MAVKTKSIYEPAEPGDGVRVLITRYYPRGVKKDRFDRWIKPLSPSRDLLTSYRAGGKSWAQFRECFISELRESPESLAELRALATQSRAEDITLLCYEKEGLPCHRNVVREVLNKPELLSGFLESRTAGDRRSRKAETPPRPRKAPDAAKSPSARTRSSSLRRP